MAGWLVKKYHYRPAYRRGDLEDETILAGAYPFDTRKDAKNYVEGELAGRKEVYRDWKKGTVSRCCYWTGKTWTHENTGETCRESYTYFIGKASDFKGGRYDL